MNGFVLSDEARSDLFGIWAFVAGDNPQAADKPTSRRAASLHRFRPATTLKVRDNVPLGTPPARFLRVKVMAAL